MADERRKYSRHVVSLECTWDGTTRFSPSRISDFGLGGCYVDGRNVPDVDALIDITVVLRDVSVKLRGRVVYSRPEMGFAVEFADLDLETRELLIKFLAAAAE